MKTEVTWPFRFVRVRKIAQVRVPVNPAADPRTYPYGRHCSTDSLPVEYWLLGWMLLPPVVGEPVRVLRVARNGISMPGHFITTDVMEVPAAGEFHTMNSVYYWDEIAGLFPIEETKGNLESRSAQP